MDAFPPAIALALHMSILAVRKRFNANEAMIAQFICEFEPVSRDQCCVKLMCSSIYIHEISAEYSGTVSVQMRMDSTSARLTAESVTVCIDRGINLKTHEHAELGICTTFDCVGEKFDETHINGSLPARTITV